MLKDLSGKDGDLRLCIIYVKIQSLNIIAIYGFS